jgi:hypothetical protein
MGLHPDNIGSHRQTIHFLIYDGHIRNDGDKVLQQILT